MFYFCLKTIVFSSVCNILIFTVSGFPVDGDVESSTIRIEDRANGILPAGPYLIDRKPVKDGEEVEFLKAPQMLDYVIYPQLVTWIEAVTACEKHGYILAVLPNMYEADTLTKQLIHISAGADIIDHQENLEVKSKEDDMELGLSRRYWIGLSDHLAEGKWMWAGLGVPLTYNDYWYPGQPSHNEPGTTTPGEHCGSLWNPGYYLEENEHRFNDAPCTDKYYAICDIRGPEKVKALVADDDDSPEVNTGTQDDE